MAGRLRITTTSSAAGATARIAVIVQAGCGFLSGGRRGASADDREDGFGRATVALTRDIQLSPWLSWYRGILVADRLLVVVRFPAGPRVRLTWRPAERHRALAKKRS